MLRVVAPSPHPCSRARTHRLALLASVALLTAVPRLTTAAEAADAAPGAFGKAMPSNGRTGMPQFLALGWGPSPGATSYDYCYDTTNDNVCNVGWTPAGTNTVVSIAGLLQGVTYFWQVRAHDASGSVEADSGWFAFSTAAGQPGPFAKTSPATGTTNLGLTPSLSWEASDGATSYEYCYDRSNDGGCFNWVDVGTSRFVSVTGLVQPRTTYYWQVRARNGYGTVEADNAVWWTFSTRLPIGMYLFDDMEKGTSGWSAESPWQATTELWHSYGHAWSDSPGGNYAPNSNRSLTSPSFGLSAARARLRFWENRDLAAGDQANIWVTTNNGLSYTFVTSFTGTTSGWKQSFVDLSAFSGSASVRVVFQLLSDGALQGDGWYIDDVFVERAAAISDFDGDGGADILLQHASSSWIGAWRLSSAGLPTAFLPIAFGDTQGWKPVGIGDFNGDGRNDIVLQHPSSWVGVWFLDAAHQPLVFHYVAPYDIGDWKVVGTTDLDNDGITDLLLQHPTEGVGAWRLGEFAQPHEFFTIVRTPMNGWRVVGTADITGDGITDIILQHTGGWVGAWRMPEFGWPASLFGSPTGFVPIAFGDTAGWQVVGVADVDRDGAADLVLQHPTQGVGAWRLNADGQLIGFHPIALGDLGGWKVNGRN